MDSSTMINMLEIFKNNLDKIDLVQQNKQINILIDNLKLLESANLVRLAEQDKNIINFKLGDMVKINNEILYIKDIRHDKPDFPSKTKENVLVLDTINLSNPSTYYFNSRDNRTPSRSLEFSKLKNIEYLNNVDFETIDKFFQNNAKYNQILVSRLIFDTSNNEFNLKNTNDLYKRQKSLVYDIQGIEVLSNSVVRTYNYINDFDLFSNQYRELYLKIHEDDLDSFKQDDLTFRTNTYDDYLNKTNNLLLDDLDKLFEINEIQKELSNKIFNYKEIEHNFDRN